MAEIITKNLLLVPCSLDISKSLIIHRQELEKRSPIVIPKHWPSLFIKGILPLYIERLEKDETELCWGVWLIIEYKDKQIIGDFYLKGKPDAEGRVEFCHHLNPEFSIDHTHEALYAFTDWLLLEKSITAITTHCTLEQELLINAFGKLGLICTDRDQDYLTWSLKKIEEDIHD